MPIGNMIDAGSARTHTRRGRAFSTLAVSALLVGTLGAGAVHAQDTSGDPAAVTGDASFFGWDVADLTAGLGIGFETARQAFQAQNPGTNITFDAVPFADFVSAATTRARAGTLGDIVEMLPGLNHAPVFEALAATTQADWGALGDELSGWAGGVIDPADPTSLAGVPIGGQGVMWYYNKALFTQAGLDPEKPPTTWAEFVAAADALKTAGIAPVASSGVDSFLSWWAWSSFSPQYFSPEEVLGIRSGDIPLDDPRVLASLAPIKEMFDAGYWNADYADKSFTDMESAFINGDVAMIPGSSPRSSTGRRGTTPRWAPMATESLALPSVTMPPATASSSTRPSSTASTPRPRTPTWPRRSSRSWPPRRASRSCSPRQASSPIVPTSTSRSTAAPAPRPSRPSSMRVARSTSSRTSSAPPPRARRGRS